MTEETAAVVWSLRKLATISVGQLERELEWAADFIETHEDLADDEIGCLEMEAEHV